MKYWKVLSHIGKTFNCRVLLCLMPMSCCLPYTSAHRIQIVTWVCHSPSAPLGIKCPKRQIGWLMVSSWVDSSLRRCHEFFPLKKMGSLARWLSSNLYSMSYCMWCKGIRHLRCSFWWFSSQNSRCTWSEVNSGLLQWLHWVRSS